MKRDYKTALDIVKDVVSDTGRLYVDEFVNSDTESIRRAWEAFNIEFLKSKSDLLPLAYQIELYFCHAVYRRIRISPMTCLYYLMFLCYHELKQYDNRNQVLRELENVASALKNGNIIIRQHAYNIAGHCLLVAGEKCRARDMFLSSHQYLTNMCSSLNKYIPPCGI